MNQANSVDQTGAFPTGSPEHGSQNGLTKREYFAAMAMQGLTTYGAFIDVEFQGSVEERNESESDELTKPEITKGEQYLVKSAVELADLLILELEK